MEAVCTYTPNKRPRAVVNGRGHGRHGGADMAKDIGHAPTTITGQVIIDGGDPLPGRLTIEQEWIRVRSDRATKPDPSWEFTDAAGHWHAFAEPDDTAKAADLPTLNRETVEVPCDGSCGGVCDGTYSVARFTCRACGQEVEPRWIPDESARNVGQLIAGLKDWTLEIESYDRPLRYAFGEQISIRMDADAGTFLGIGCAVHHTAQSGGFEGFHATVTIGSASPLGKRLT